MTYDVFISHTQKDKPTAEAACATLEKNGVRCWIAPRDVEPGKLWAAAIFDAIAGCRAMVLIFSRDTNQSEHVGREVEMAVRGSKRIIPFRIENVQPTGSLGYFMGATQWLDAFTTVPEKHFQELVSTVRRQLGLAPTDAAPTADRSSRLSTSVNKPGPVATQGAPAPRRSSRLWLVVGLTVVVAGSALAVVFLLRSPSPTPSAAIPVPEPSPATHVTTLTQPERTSAIAALAAAPPASPAETKTPDLHLALLNFVTRYYTIMNGPSDSAIAFLDATLADPTSFYGRVQSKATIVASEQHYISRWPERNYVPEPDSVTSSCSGQVPTCDVTLTVDFDVSSPARNASSKGQDKVMLHIVDPAGTPIVTSVSGITTLQKNRTLPEPSAATAVPPPPTYTLLNNEPLLATPEPYGSIIETVTVGDTVTATAGDQTDPAWIHVTTSDGQNGYIASQDLARQ